MKMMLQNIRERSEALLADGQRQNDTGNTDPPKPKKMTSEEVQRMLADFYQEVERREQEEGRPLHISTNKVPRPTCWQRLRSLFSSSRPTINKRKK